MNMINKKIFCIFLFISIFYFNNVQSSDIDTNNIFSELLKKFPMVSDIQNQIGKNFTIDDAKKIFSQKCFNVTGDEKYFDAIDKSSSDFMTCIQDQLNITAIQEEMEIAKPAGELDTVFNKYCKKRNDAMKCVTDFSSKVKPCLTKEENDNYDMLMKIINRLLDFVCYKGGDQIALFIAERGPECLQDSAEAIQHCLNKTLNNLTPNDTAPTTNLDINNLNSLVVPAIVLGKQECKEIDEFEECVVHVLEECEEITPVNIVESMFKYIKNETQCPKASPLQTNYQLNLKPNLTIINVFIIFSGFIYIFY